MDFLRGLRVSAREISYSSKSFRNCNAFSLIEVALALAIASFTFTSVLALLPLGVKTNQISAEESRAVCILSTLEADLRNTHPLQRGGKSAIFGLLLPYEADETSGNYAYNSLIQSPTTSLSLGSTTTGIDEGERAVTLDASSRPPFQVSVIYTVIPAKGSLNSLQARLVVNWIATPENDISAVTDLTKVRGFVETVVSFPAP